jgi:BirA family biotin operon repressor/biotin-[acetyl-CoA-carboxylase] ligase
MHDKLDETEIRARLDAVSQAGLRGIHIFPQLDSTNRWCLQEGQCGDVCLAEQQTAGRGRRGRNWESPAGVNLYLSLRWCFPHVPQHLSMLGLVVGLAVAEALETCGIRGHGLKWPNDIVFPAPLAGEGSGMGGIIAIKKLGGILLEAVGSLEQVVIGIGLNVNIPALAATAIDQPWTSLLEATGHVQSRNWLVAAILQRLVARLQAFPQLDMAQFQQDWQRWDILAQRQVRVLSGAETLDGLACGVDTHGQLRVRLTDGFIKAFSSADVSVRM